MITIITGDRGIGKTSFLLRISKDIKKHDKNIYGILSTPLFNNKNIKNGFSAMDLYSDEKWELARIDKDMKGPTYGPYHFSTAGFSRANETLRLSLCKKNALIIIDEIGPLELTHKQGFYDSLTMLHQSDLSNRIYLVIRPELIEEFARRFIGDNQYRIFTINEENRDHMPFDF